MTTALAGREKYSIHVKSVALANELHDSTEKLLVDPENPVSNINVDGQVARMDEVVRLVYTLDSFNTAAKKHRRILASLAHETV